ncbi:GGDEF domain-containing protein [Desulfoluna spongiiphila]|uniref:GGDEF domain-containing protein n=1 Tax=Desulfoluna spongiiphila TaxID=419481 RepID=UPI00125BC12A|nr:GGDEF domain-containing protein [Desulfoluna spongiiphila]VVS93083.1 nucleotide cyclase [Desulfoluna spongiiphila]
MLRSQTARHTDTRPPETDELPPDIQEAWQRILSLLRSLLEVPVVLVMRPCANGAETVMVSRDDAAPPWTEEASAMAQGMGTPKESAFLAEPICHADGRVFGTLCAMDTKPNPFSHRALLTEFRHTMESHLALMETRRNLEKETERAEALSSQLAREALTDPLTGLLHRCTFADRFHQEIARHKRAHHPLSLILCNLDHFRPYNATMGRARGDALLVTLAGLLKARLRTHDLVWRWGGDEFLLLLPDTPLMGAVEVVESIRHIVEATTANEPDPRITLSAGATNLAPEETQDTCLDRCNSLLKAAKAKGRNCVIIG